MTSRNAGVAYRFWERIDRLMYERRMTQQELVARSGVSAMTINRLKTQTRPPKSETIHALADALGIDRDEAAVLAGRLRPSGEHAPSVRDAILASATLTESNKRTMIDLYEQLSEAHAASNASSDRRALQEDNRSDGERTARNGSSDRRTPHEDSRSDDERTAI